MQTKGFALLLCTAAACTGDVCVVPPCAPPMALNVTIKSTTGAAVGTATIVVTGASQTSMPCNGSCIVSGYAGTYHLTVSAPGYAQTTVDQTVTGHDNGKCGCPTVDTKSVEIKLAPSA
jgi:hypothetical protein